MQSLSTASLTIPFIGLLYHDVDIDLDNVDSVTVPFD